MTPAEERARKFYLSLSDIHQVFLYLLLQCGVAGDALAGTYLLMKDDMEGMEEMLTSIEKGKLLDELASISIPGQTDLSSEGTQESAVGSNPTAGEQESINPSLSEVKDKRLLSILQNKCSKIVDENGEPMVVYHGTPSPAFTEFAKLLWMYDYHPSREQIQKELVRMVEAKNKDEIGF